MKKLLVSMIAVAMLAFGTVSASAVVSPSVGGEDNTPKATSPSANNNNNNSNNNSSSNNSTTSPKTGVSGTYAIFAALSVIACGGVATVAKRKLSK